MKPIIYNYPGGAGGEGFAANQHSAEHFIDKMGKVKLKDDRHNLPKSLVLSGDDFFQTLMSLPDFDFYLTHHLYLLDEEQLALLTNRFDLVNISNEQDHNETFLLKIFKDYAKIKTGEVSLFLNGKTMRKSVITGSVLGELHDLLQYEFDPYIPSRIRGLITEYSMRRGEFYQDHLRWHSKRYPGVYIKYKKKVKMGIHYSMGHYWNLDDLLEEMESNAQTIIDLQH